MNILTPWLRSYLPELPVDDHQLAEDLTLRGIAVEGEFTSNALSGVVRLKCSYVDFSNITKKT